MNTRPDFTLFLPALRAGGTERVFLHLAKAFVERGYVVDLVLREKDGPYLTDIPDKVQVFDLKGCRNFRALFPLASYLRRRRPYALLSALDHINLTAIWANLISGVKTRVVVSVRTLVSRAYQLSVRDKQSLLPPLIRVTYPLADAVVCVCRSVQQDLCKIGGRWVAKKTIVIYNPILIDYIHQKAQDSLTLSFPPYKTTDCPIIVSVGRLIQAKDYPTMVKALARLLTIQPAYLLIIGDGEEKENIQSLINHLGISQHCQLMGFISNPYPYIAKADLFVLSSAWEGFPNVVAEALVLRRPIVATDCGGVREILADGKWGRIVPIGDIEMLALAMKEGLEGRILVDWNGLEEYLQSFSIEKIAEQYIRVMLG